MKNEEMRCERKRGVVAPSRGNDPTLSMVDEAMDEVEQKSQALSQLCNVYLSLLLVH